DDPSVGFPAGAWLWDEKRIKFGKKSHTTPHPRFRDEDVRHSFTFKTGFSAHMVATPNAAAEVDKELANALAMLPPDKNGVSILAQADRLWAADADKRKAVRISLLQKAEPGDAARWLDHFLDLEIRRGNVKAHESVETFAKEAKAPEKLLTEFRA